MNKQTFTPHHVNITEEDLVGNNGIGRYILLPGSDGRAKKFAEMYFDNVEIKDSPRGHNLYKGTITNNGHKIDMASISTGMGCPSTDIILTELFRLGGRRFLRVGTSGSLQPDRIKVGHLAIPTGVVRDEGTSKSYVPAEFPAIPSFEITLACKKVADSKDYKKEINFGIVHCKDSLFAREFGAGPMRNRNEDYMQILKGAGAIASEMESSQLFILSSLFNHELIKLGSSEKVLGGTVLSIIGDDDPFTSKELADIAIQRGMDFSIDVIKELASSELNFS